MKLVKYFTSGPSGIIIICINYLSFFISHIKYMDKIKLDFKNKYYLNNSDYLSSYRDYKSLYYKYKTKYLNALKKYGNQVGGAEKDKLDKIIEMYQKIPETGLYGKNISLEKFKEYCKFVIEETKDDPEVIDLKRKHFLEKKIFRKQMNIKN